MFCFSSTLSVRRNRRGRNCLYLSLSVSVGFHVSTTPMCCLLRIIKKRLVTV